VLGTKGKLPVEVVPFAVSLAQRKLRDLGCDPVLWMKDGKVGVTDNGNQILDCGIKTIPTPASFISVSATSPASSIRACSSAWPTWCWSGTRTSISSVRKSARICRLRLRTFWCEAASGKDI